MFGVEKLFAPKVNFVDEEVAQVRGLVNEAKGIALNPQDQARFHLHVVQAAIGAEISPNGDILYHELGSAEQMVQLSHLVLQYQMDSIGNSNALNSFPGEINQETFGTALVMILNAGELHVSQIMDLWNTSREVRKSAFHKKLLWIAVGTLMVGGVAWYFLAGDDKKSLVEDTDMIDVDNDDPEIIVHDDDDPIIVVE